MDNSLFSLSGKVALVTGGGRGIGRAIALGMADAGADIIVTSRTAAQIDDSAARIREKGRKALAVVADSRMPEQVTAALNRTLEEFGRVDIMVNNSGGTFLAPVLKLSINGWESILKENLSAVFICSRIIGEAMVKQKSGTIINISSVAGLGAYPDSSAYGAAKAGIIAFTRTLAVEWAEYNVRVNAIAPGLIPNDVTNVMRGEGLSKDRQTQLSRIPMRRFGTPGDIAGPAVFLASAAASYITGECLVVNGGLTTTVFND